MAGLRRVDAVPPVRSFGARRGFATYMRFAAIVTFLGYALGYSTVGFGLLFFGAVWCLATRRRLPWARTAIDFPLAAFGAILVISAAASPYHRVALSVTLMLILSGAVYYGSFSWLLRSEPAVRSVLLRSWVFGTGIAAFVGLWYSATNVTNTVRTGHLGHVRAEIPRGVGPNGLGTTLLLGSLLAFGGMFQSRGWSRVAWALSSLLILVGLVATGSRASLAGWVVGAGFLVYRELRARPFAMAVVALSSLVVVGAVAAGSPQLADRLRYTLSDVKSNRIQIWHTSLRMISEHPLLGSGFGTFQASYDRHRAAGASPEPFAFNLWLNLAVETGMLGLAAALWVTIAAVLAGRRAPGESEQAEARDSREEFPRSAVAALWMGLLVNQLADNTLFSISTSAALWILLALILPPATVSQSPAKTDRPSA